MMGAGQKPTTLGPQEPQEPLWWFIKVVSILSIIVAPAFFTSCARKHIFSDIHT